MASSDPTPITINDRLYRTVREGKASILAPYRRENDKSKKSSARPGGLPKNNDEGDQAVFYNPIQQYNRDLSVLAILVYGESAVQIKNSRQYRNKERLERKKAAKLCSATGSSTQKPNSGTAPRKRSLDEAELLEDDETEESSSKRTRHESENHINGQQNDEVTRIEPGNLATSPEAKPARVVPFTILDALSASGLRAIRYAKEIPFATTIVANDLLPEAVQAIDLNIEHNELKGRVFSNVGDARQFMYSKTGNEAANQGPGYVHKFDVVDLDPYGTAAPFLDAAIQAVTDGGLLCVTCTDAGVWASNGYPEKAFALYGGIPLKGPHSHEAGLRLILHSIATSASKYGIAIEPLLSLSIDFYCRLFIRVHKSQQDVKLMAGTTMLVYNCDSGCGAWETQLVARNSVREAKNGDGYFKHGFAQGPSTNRTCQHCGSKAHLGGPMWAGPLHNPVFVRKILDKLPNADKTVYGTTDRIKGMLTLALEEEDTEWEATKTKNDDKQVNGGSLIARMPPHLISPAPFLFIPTYLAKVLSLPTPAEDPLRGAFLALGYHCSRSHCKPGSFKTNAPWTVIWQVMREWARQKESERIPRLLGLGEFEGKGSVKSSSAGWNILKRLRDRENDSLHVARTREHLAKKLSLGHGAADIESVSDLQSILKSALYELEHPTQRPEPALETAQEPTDGESINIDTAGKAETVAKAGPNKISGKALIEKGGDVSELDIIFDAQLGRSFRDSKHGKLVRYQMNPRANWGPMNRAGTG